MDLVEEYLTLTRTESQLNLLLASWSLHRAFNHYFWARWVLQPLFRSSLFCGRGFQGDACRIMVAMVLVSHAWLFHLLCFALSLRRNLKDLVDNLDASSETNYCRTFWRWLSRQKWRKMLPKPVEYLFLIFLYVFKCVLCIRVRWLITFQSAQGPCLVARHVSRSASVSIHLACPSSNWYEARYVSLQVKLGMTGLLFSGISHIYNYSFDLFKDKLIGPEGFPCSISYYFLCCKWVKGVE